MDVPVSTGRFIRREIKRPDTQEAIYWEAVRLFRERGYHATSIRDIAAAVGIQPATIYHYFGGKEAILYTIMERIILHLLEEQERVLAGSDDPREQLRAMLRMHVRLHCEQALEAYVADTELRGLGEELYARILAYRDQYQVALRQVIERGVHAGAFSVPDVHVATNILLVMATSSVTWYHANGSLSLDQIADIHADLALKAVGAPSTEAAEAARRLLTSGQLAGSASEA